MVREVEAKETAEVEYLEGNKYIKLKKRMGHQWGPPNSNYMLVMVPTFVMPFSIDHSKS